MSMMKCHCCECLVDTDDDPASLDMPGYDNECICERCRAKIDGDNYGGDIYDSDYEEHSTYFSSNGKA